MLMRFIGYLTLDTLVVVPHSTQPEVLPDGCHCPSVWGRTGIDREIQGASFIIECQMEDKSIQHTDQPCPFTSCKLVVVCVKAKTLKGKPRYSVEVRCYDIP